ncbi:hypothetical protein BLNAU_9977 [Blattamonas nauphoetae]|uniref:Uncharacterized protein n=1 Tax=Blattamonas nauphoetae TaxID=2049346 RepID=A0ABQ9XU81_9EUKA|nr:hypothetical protein BLNAU_9977 [Blattamonas nauphoetae]
MVRSADLYRPHQPTTTTSTFLLLTPPISPLLQHPSLIPLNFANSISSSAISCCSTTKKVCSDSLMQEEAKTEKEGTMTRMDNTIPLSCKCRRSRPIPLTRSRLRQVVQKNILPLEYAVDFHPHLRSILADNPILETVVIRSVEEGDIELIQLTFSAIITLLEIGPENRTRLQSGNLVKKLFSSFDFQSVPLTEADFHSFTVNFIRQMLAVDGATEEIKQAQYPSLRGSVYDHVWKYLSHVITHSPALTLYDTHREKHEDDVSTCYRHIFFMEVAADELDEAFLLEQAKWEVRWLTEVENEETLDFRILTCGNRAYRWRTEKWGRLKRRERMLRKEGWDDAVETRVVGLHPEVSEDLRSKVLAFGILAPALSSETLATKLITDLVPSSTGSPSGFLESILTLISSPYLKVVAAALSLQITTIQAASPEVWNHFAESDFIANVLAILQPHTPPISRNEFILRDLFRIISQFAVLAFPSSLRKLGITASADAFNHREMLFQKVVLPSSQFVNFLISNRHILNLDSVSSSNLGVCSRFSDCDGLLKQSLFHRTP